MSTPSIQQLIADSLLQNFSDVIIKKIDTDNYLDIHVPSIHPKKGTHIFFNTSKQKIKIGFYCREEEFVQQALAKGGGLLEEYAQGIRLKGNPEFSDVKTAIAATLKFIEVLSQKSSPAAPTNTSETYTFDKAVKAFLKGNMEYVAAYVQAGNPVLQFNGDILITNELISYISASTGVDRRIVNLVEAGVDLDASFDGGEGYTAAHFAAWDGKDEILYYLLDAGAKADVVGEDGYTPIFLAAAGGHLDCVEDLVEKGADVNRRLKDDNIYFSKQGGTPLTVAFINGYLTTALYLIEQGADPLVLLEPCTINAPSPNLFVNFLNLVKQGKISQPEEGQLSKILSLVGLDIDENLVVEDSTPEDTQDSGGQLDLNEFLKELDGSAEEEAPTAEDLDEEGQINLYELIQKFVEKQGADNILDLLDQDYSQKGDIVVVKIDADDLIKTLSTNEQFGDFVYISGIISFKSDTLWADLSELIGKSEINWIQNLVELENPDTMVLLYCEGNYVYAFSNMNETENVNGEDSSVEAAPESSGHLDLNKVLKELDSGDGGEVSLKSTSEEEEINLDELIKKFVEKHGKKNIMDFLGQKYSFEEDLFVVEIDADDLLKTLTTTDHFGDFVSISGIINLKEDTLWDELSELIGESEADSWKELWDENWDSVVLLYCGGKYVCSFSNQEEEAPSEELAVEGEESEEEGGFPMITFRKPAEGMGDAVKQYLSHWQKPSQFYAWRMGVKAYIPEFVEALFSDKVCPIFTFQEIEAICSHITSEKIIPVLDYVPEELYNHTKRVWWLVPFCIWKDSVASLMFVDKNGFYAMFSNDGEEEINMIFNWDSVDELDLEYEYDGDPNINRLTLIQEDGNFLTFDEFVSDPEDGSHGSYLAVIEAIWEVRRETIEASKGESMWFEGKGGEGFKEFKKPQDLLQDSKWKNPSRPDPSMFGG